MKRFWIGIAVIVVLVGGFMAWVNASKAPEVATTTKVLSVGVHPWIGNGLYYVAEEKGLFNAEGINVKLEDYTDGAVGKQLLASGKLNVLASLTPETPVVVADSGTKVKVIGMTDTSIGADGIIASANIKTLADLKGKKVAYEESSPSHFYLSYLLDQEGMTTKDLQSVNVTAPDAAAAFFAGNVDAAVTWEPWLSTATERQGGHLIATTKNAPILPALVIVREDTLTERPQDLKAMMRALFAAQEWIKANPTEAYSIMAKRFNIPVKDVTDQIPTFKWFSEEESKDGFTSGEYSAKNLIQVAADLWLKLGLVKTQINASDLIDTSILKNR